MDNEFAGAEPAEAARAIVSDRFPDARAAFLSAGILSPRRTPTSDLDIVVVLAGPPAPYRESLRWHGWPVGSADPGETAVTGWNVWTATAELALLLAGHWLDSGKWLLRELRAADPDLADRMVAAIGSQAKLTPIADEVLGRAGGRFWAGLRVTGS